MIKSLYSGVTGLKTHNQRMDVIGNNIANVNTTGFKAGTVTFKDVYYQTRQNASGGTFTQGGINPMQTGMGVQLGTISKVMSQSGFTYSDSVLDMALTGSGFFQLMDSQGNLFYTRLGRFELDDYGNLTDANGNVVLGVSGDPTNVPASSQRINLRVPDIEESTAFANKVHNGHGIIIRAGGTGPGGNIALSIQQIRDGEAPFADMSGMTLNLRMDLTKQYEALAMYGSPTSAIGQFGVGTDPGFVDPANPTPLELQIRAEWRQNLLTRISDLFSEDMNEAIRLGGVNIDPAVIPLTVEFTSVPDITEATPAGNNIRLPDYVVPEVPASPTVTQMTYLNLLRDPALTDLEIFNLVSQVTTSGPLVTAFNNLRNAGLPPFTVVTDDQAATRANFMTALNTWEADNTSPSVPAYAVAGGVLQFTMNEAGAAGNRRQINIKVDAGETGARAIWDNNVLTISVANSHALTLETIQNAINIASNGDPRRMITVLGPATVGTGGFVGSTLPLGMTGGSDSYFQDAFENLGSVVMGGGAYQTAQTVSDVRLFVGENGIIYGEHPVHGTLLLGRVDTVEFPNPEGLQQVGTSYFVQTLASGPPQVKIPTEDTDTGVAAGALEMSNVDLSNEFSDMIVTQRGFQANSRIITVSDSMLEELVNLKR